MQHEFVSSANGDRPLPSSISPLMFVPPDHQIPSPRPYYSTASDFLGLYTSVSPPNKVTNYDLLSLAPGTAPLSFSPSPISLGDEDPIAIESRLYLARLALQYQQIADRYELCLSHLHDSELEAEAIIQQNAQLRCANKELFRRLNLNSGKYEGRNTIASNQPPMSLLDEHFGRLSMAEPPDEASPTSVLGLQNNLLGMRCCGVEDKRLTLPKSISIRSTGYLKIHQTGGSSPESNRSSRYPPPSPVMQQQVCLGGAEKKVEVYNQGMFKTELCNKWQETGECPYGEHCQFAHGISELRPVIRHPRYKTELCRMVLAGDNCPYGHRCHFRHYLTPDDGLLRPT